MLIGRVFFLLGIIQTIIKMKRIIVEEWALVTAASAEKARRNATRNFYGLYFLQF